MPQGGYEQDAPGQKADWELGNLGIERIVMPGGGSAPHTQWKEPLQLIVNEKDLQIFRASLLPKSDKPRKGHHKKYQHAEPQAHSE